MPPLDTVATKLCSFIDAAPRPDGSHMKGQTKETITATVVPYLKERFVSPKSEKNSLSSLSPDALSTLSELADSLPLESLFPLVDMWRLALLDPAVTEWATINTRPLTVFLSKAANSQPPKPFILTLLKALCNAFSNTKLIQKLFVVGKRELTTVLVAGLLHDDASVRTSAASLAFNTAAFVQKSRVEKAQTGGSSSSNEDGDWEVEMVSAVVEAISREKENEEVGKSETVFHTVCD